MLPLTFENAADYGKIQNGDVISVLGVKEGEFQRGVQVTMVVKTLSGDEWRAKLNHTFHAHQILWLRAGDALNHFKSTAL